MTLDHFIEEVRALPVKWMVFDDQIRTDSTGDHHYCPILAVAVYGHGQTGFDVDEEVNDEYRLAAYVIGLDDDMADLIAAASDRPAPVSWAPQWDSGLRQRLLAATGLGSAIVRDHGRGPPLELRPRGPASAPRC